MLYLGEKLYDKKYRQNLHICVCGIHMYMCHVYDCVCIQICMGMNTYDCGGQKSMLSDFPCL